MKKIVAGVVLCLCVGLVYFFIKERNVVQPTGTVSNAEYITYKHSEYSPEFTYPRSWGTIALQEGNKVCPEDDTYRTPDTLHVFDWEFSFSDMHLPQSESVMRTGIRIYTLDQKKLNRCGDEFLLKIARKEIDPETISSFMLQSVTNRSGLRGIYNQEASRLNTESRKQYTFFLPTPTSVYVIQAYMSFIPYFGSPELEEMEKQFKGDMATYLKEGRTSNLIREYFNEFDAMAESIRFTGEWQ